MLRYIVYYMLIYRLKLRLSHKVMLRYLKLLTIDNNEISFNTHTYVIG